MTTKVKQVKKEAEPVKQPMATRYFYGLGRRKSAIAKVRLFQKGQGVTQVNNLDYSQYFPYLVWQDTVKSPLEEANLLNKFDVAAKVIGGGKRGQSEAVRLGVARALLEYDKNLRKTLRAKGFLTRDPRVKERKKPGLKRARRAPQWAKR